MASSFVGAAEVARAVNAFLDLSSGDKRALVEVIVDYPTSPDNADEEDDDDSCLPACSSVHSLEVTVV